MKQIIRLSTIGLLVAANAQAQTPPAAVDVRAELMARGAPAELASRIQQVVAQAVHDGLPTEPLADKALEGWAKQAPPERLLIAVDDLRHRLTAAREAAVEAGLTAPSGTLVSSAAQALSRGLTP